jgi:prepilin-type N-terminal cleavage/methylation domain-containing protein
MSFKGFTRVELLVVILILGIMSLVAIPIYKSYVKKSIASEGIALAMDVQLSEKIHYAEFGDFYEVNIPTSNDAVLGVDASGNKNFTTYSVSVSRDKAGDFYEIHAFGTDNRGRNMLVTLKGNEKDSGTEISESYQ